MSDIEEQFWGETRKISKKAIQKRLKGEERIRYFLTLMMCISIFLWTGFKMAYIFPLGETEARPIVSADGKTGGVENPVKDDGKRTILIIGSDKREDEAARADTIMVAFLDTKLKTVKILSIPRDTYVYISERNQNTKINHAYAYGGVSMLQNTVEELLDIQIDNHIEVSFQGFVHAIDALGGITMDVEKRMYYPAENINLQPGEQKLNGEQALAYVRYRSDGMGDIGRIERQQHFLYALGDHVLRLSSLWRIPQFVSVFRENFYTDLKLKEMLFLANTYKGMDPSTVETRMIPGEAEYIKGVSYWISFRDEVAQMIAELTGKSQI